MEFVEGDLSCRRFGWDGEAGGTEVGGEGLGEEAESGLRCRAERGCGLQRTVATG